MVLLRVMLCEEYSANSHTLQFTPPDRFRFKGLAHRRMNNQLFKSYSSMYLIVSLRFEQILGWHSYIACFDVFTHMRERDVENRSLTGMVLSFSKLRDQSEENAGEKTVSVGNYP